MVTGATSGLGLAVAQAMAAAGAAVVAVGRNADRGNEIVESIVRDGHSAVFVRGDVAVEGDVITAIEVCRSEFGTLDIMHNNAAFFVTAELHETTTADWQRSLQTNLSSVFWGCKHAVQAMREQGGGGSIINTASVAAFTATADTPAYVATKSGVMGLTRSVALGYASEGIRCNALCPGDFESPMLDAFLLSQADPSNARQEFEALYPTKRILKPADVANAAVFLASDESSGVNGTSLVVDDGLTAKTY
ncbi:NAD(P)-dependent dehydrogenase, short-chain alcohol dehydrogenase family [Mycolicibacterium neoaurum]|nr:NAD(P)-dependent dehydrogenase, short-chain alcohol dehydrogenase family [Mycolicibacterium neoaurum]